MLVAEEDDVPAAQRLPGWPGGPGLNPFEDAIIAIVDRNAGHRVNVRPSLRRRLPSLPPRVAQGVCSPEQWQEMLARRERERREAEEHERRRKAIMATPAYIRHTLQKAWALKAAGEDDRALRLCQKLVDVVGDERTLRHHARTLLQNGA